MTDYRLTLEDPGAPAPTALITELSAELAILYPKLRGGDGSKAGGPADARPPIIRPLSVVLEEPRRRLVLKEVRPPLQPKHYRGFPSSSGTPVLPERRLLPPKWTERKTQIKNFER